MQTFSVSVRNEETGEVATIVVEGSHLYDGLEKALRSLFRDRGWRKAVAISPDVRPADVTGWEWEYKEFLERLAKRMDVA